MNIKHLDQELQKQFSNLLYNIDYLQENYGELYTHDIISEALFKCANTLEDAEIDFLQDTPDPEVNIDCKR